MSAYGQSISGQAEVIDGDTLIVAGERIRLMGIDAPERKQICWDLVQQSYRCGEWVTVQLQRGIGHSRVICELHGKDRYGRHLGRCRVGEHDLGFWLVQQGLAVTYRTEDRELLAAERDARRQRRGLWSGAFQQPSIWRKSRPGQP
ncbi:MAG: thermonuclease family protein [Zavarzinella sp.]